MSSKAERRFANEQLARSRQDHQRWLDEQAEKFRRISGTQPEVQEAIAEGIAEMAERIDLTHLPIPIVTAEDIYTAVDIVRSGGRRARARARVLGYTMRPTDHDSYTVSWSHTVSSGVTTVEVYRGGDGSPMVMVDGVCQRGFGVGGYAPEYADPRLAPVDIIDKIDEVLADEEHPQHIDAWVNYQIEKYRHGQR